MQFIGGKLPARGISVTRGKGAPLQPILIISGFQEMVSVQIKIALLYEKQSIIGFAQLGLVINPEPVTGHDIVIPQHSHMTLCDRLIFTLSDKNRVGKELKAVPVNLNVPPGLIRSCAWSKVTLSALTFTSPFSGISAANPVWGGITAPEMARQIVMIRIRIHHPDI